MATHQERKTGTVLSFDYDRAAGQIQEDAPPGAAEPGRRLYVAAPEVTGKMIQRGDRVKFYTYFDAKAKTLKARDLELGCCIHFP